jgi:hypothetical protein
MSRIEFLARLRTAALLVACALVTRTASAESPPSGEQIYKRQCASCHGRAGEGTRRYRKQLAGDRSLPQLATLINRTMPENDPGSLTAEEAKRVAAYIDEAFYSAAARERNRPRIELARLTVRQYRSAVADLIGAFRAAPRWDDQRGLKGEYYSKRYFDGGARVLERVDREVRFDFGTGGPLAERIQPHEFSIRWTGSVLAPETGVYEFVVRTEHAARLWVNDLQRPLIDAGVKSGHDREYRGSLFLVGGRPYPLRLEYSKGKQGVDDSKTAPKPPPTPSSIALAWARPHRAVETIPGRCLSPIGNPETYAVTTPFPPDDSSYGWERGTTISREWEQAATEAAVETAGYVAAHLNSLAGTHDGDPEREKRVRAFCLRFAERAFRRPLSDEQKRLCVERQFAATKEPETAVKRAVLLVLISPRFLYREVGGEGDGYDVAARLSFALWESLPDEELLQAAAEGKLATREQVVRQAKRMLGDVRARTRLRQFLLTWLKVEQPREAAKDPHRFPGFDAAVVSDLRTSLELFLDDVIGDAKADFRRLLLTEHLYVNGRLARFYGAELPAEADFQQVKAAPGGRAGVLTHPYLMATFAHTGQTSPIHRGVFLARGILGVSLRPPPEAFAPFAADLHPTLTTRERVTLQTKPATCMTCHGIINPLGYTLEHFDAIGRYRQKDNAKPIDATGTYLTRDGRKVTFTGARQLAEFLAGSPEVHEAFVEQMFHHLIQQPVRAYGPQALADLRRTFAAQEFNIRRLAVEIVTTAALTRRDVKPNQPPRSP